MWQIHNLLQCRTPVPHHTTTTRDTILADPDPRTYTGPNSQPITWKVPLLNTSHRGCSPQAPSTPRRSRRHRTGHLPSVRYTTLLNIPNYQPDPAKMPPRHKSVPCYRVQLPCQLIVNTYYQTILLTKQIHRIPRTKVTKQFRLSTLSH